ncbi:hypothetical protein [Olleya namhaensis]|uniref:hypothetical protein n=1 Tax=Olleya namhaensis TaxID=1144750 RepID=UPI00232C8A13|nr:hypothetical protein [Olleya namhaensis]
MSDVRTCPTCGAKAKFKVKETIETYTAVQDDDAFKKITQLKKAMNAFKEKAEALEQELEELKRS